MQSLVIPLLAGAQVMADLEMGVYGGIKMSTSYAANLTFVTAMVKGDSARPSLIPSLCTHFTRAGIEWLRCHHAARMVRPYKEPHHSGQAEP